MIMDNFDVRVIIFDVGRITKVVGGQKGYRW